MLPAIPRLAKCPHCDNLVWLESATRVGAVLPIDLAATWPNAPRYIMPDELDLLAAIESPLVDSADKLLHVRICAWRAANDQLRRADDGDPVNFSKEAVRNMERLLDELSESDEQQRLMKAEVARELGRFEEAENLLATPFSAELEHARGRIAELTRAKEVRVAVF